MSKSGMIKKIEVIQGKIQSLASQLGQDCGYHGMHCQTASREMAELQKKIESGQIKTKKG